ncbi:cGMP-specific 3',5'-cyclic phosphodiesterase [Orchesella cincta]|uniref:Phosphodiesterase n=1 Tax=Orchesella cincta TaxID=48709 RepID=A0A1D2MK92_ORCCI|nr:cGMP-specific 3',5'-cyclic phosphodiesterase [Orchesella cincta]
MESTPPVKSELEAYLESHPEFIQTWLKERASPETKRKVLGCCSTPVISTTLTEQSSNNDTINTSSIVNNNNNSSAVNNNTVRAGSPPGAEQAGESSTRVKTSSSPIPERSPVNDSCKPSAAGENDEITTIQRPRSHSKRNSITSDRFQSWISSPKHKSDRTVPPGLVASQLEHLDENELFIELVKDISNELDIDILCHKILVNVGYLTQADRCSLFLARGPSEQRHLVAKLWDVTVDSDVEESLRRAKLEEIRIPFGVGIAGHVAQTKEIVNIKNAYEDARFNVQIDSKTGYKTHSILALPICNNEGDVIGVAQVINKKTGDFQFTEEDIELLLNLAKSIFEEQTNLERLVSKIMKEAQELLKCERCLVYLRDVPLYEASQIEKIFLMPSLPASSGDRKPLSRRESKTASSPEVVTEESINFQMVFELKNDDLEREVRRPSTNEIQNSPLTQIAKYVAANSEILNIGDAITWYGESMDVSTSNEVVRAQPPNVYNALPKSILCMPIYNGQRQVIGVAQLINKSNNQHFTHTDVNTFEAFAIFCGLGIHNTQLYEGACKLMAKQSVALDCLSYHATATPDDTERLRRDEIPSSIHYNLYSYEFNDFPMTDSETCKATIRMFLELDLVRKFHIPYAVLCRWVLSVKKNYRHVKYHNWRHAFNVAQTMFTVLKTGKMEQFLDDHDILGLLVACLCHDLDHRGTNNAFQRLTASPLAVLYSTSTMEHHHFDQCVMILSSEGNNIFQDLSAEDYRKVMKIVEKSILSTDLAMYFRKRARFIELVENGEISWQGDDKKELLCGMMMTGCDVAAISKPWEIQHKIAKLVADEFFDQGDLEKEQLNQKPQKDELPKMQLSFIDEICLPLYKVLSETFPWLQPLYDGASRNRQNWQDLAEKVDMGLTWIDYDVIEKPVEEFTKDAEPEDIDFVVQNLNCPHADAEHESGKRSKSKWKLRKLFRETSQLRKSTSSQSKASSDVNTFHSKKDDLPADVPNAFNSVSNSQGTEHISDETSRPTSKPSSPATNGAPHSSGRKGNCQIS